MTKVTPVIASLLILALIAGAGAAQVGSSNTSDINESSNQTTGMEGADAQNMSGNATDLTNAGSPLAAILEGNATRTNLTVSNVTAEIGLELVAENFTSPLAITAPDDGTGRLFVVDQIGVVQVVDANGTTLPEPFLDIRDKMVDLRPTYDERGLLSIAFHPNFSENGKVYAFYSAPLRPEAPEDWNCTNHISEFQVDPEDQNRVNTSSEKVLMYIDKPYHNHNGGQLAFSPADGYLYIALGDAGRANDVGNGHTPGIGNAQDLTKIYGKMLRIDVENVTDGNVTVPQNVTMNQTENMSVNRTANPPEPTWTTFAGSLYGIPADNPFAENQTEILDTYAYDAVPPEIYAYGFRNPAYMSFDSGGNNALFVADAGQNLFEEVDVVYNGGNYGWNIREGTYCFDPNATTAPPESCNTTGYLGEPLIGPVFEGGRDLGIVVVGGNVYRGTAVPDLEGKYVFGYWSDSRTVGNGTLLVATPPEGWDEGALPDATNLTPEANAMWEVQTVNITSGENETLGMFLRGFGEDAERELYVLTNDVGGPDNTTSTGRVWRVAAPTNVSTTPTMTGNVTPGATENVTPMMTGNVTPAAGAATTVNIAADNLAFDAGTITVPAGAEVTMVFDNQDEGVPHNVAVYDSPLRAEQIFVGEVIDGPAEITYTFTAPSEPGTYYFQCDIHPDMNGEFIVE
ncbi:MAG: PQQ-dependent sugar dehydrogenase [Methanoculleus sp.]|nr:PQQ-dependent sugar dehydrogenase [Methanoculleus sp.]